MRAGARLQDKMDLDFATIIRVTSDRDGVTQYIIEYDTLPGNYFIYDYVGMDYYYRIINRA